MAHPNEDFFRKGYEAFQTGDLDTLRSLMADDIIWHIGGRSPIAGDYKGVEETFGLFARLAELSGGTFKVELHDILANDEHAVALARSTGAREGKTMDDAAAHVVHIRDGKLIESWWHPGDSYAVDEFWS